MTNCSEILRSRQRELKISGCLMYVAFVINVVCHEPRKWNAFVQISYSINAPYQQGEENGN
jgi:hypothetical protein